MKHTSKYLVPFFLILMLSILTVAQSSGSDPLVIVVHGIGGGNQEDGWSRKQAREWGVETHEVTFRYEGRTEPTSYDDFAQRAGDWALSAQGQIKDIVRKNPGRRVIIVSHSWGTVITKMALQGGVGGGQNKVNGPTRAEIINEVARQTGLTNDAVSLIAKENPQLLQGLNDTVLGIKVVNSLADARDTEALADLMGYAVDKLRDKALPSAMNGFIVAFKVYKTALEVTRDYYYVPKLDAGLYNAYRQARADGLRRGDTSAEEISTAFERASTRDWSGYYVVKDSMFEALVKAKGYNKALMGEKMKQALWRQIDDFWMKRCEAKLMQEILQANKAELERQIWTRASRQLSAIKAAARSTGDSTNRTNENRVVPPVDRRRTEPGPSSGGSSDDQIVAEYRSLLPVVLEKNKKAWHTRINLIANAVKQGNGYHVNYQAFCLIEQGPDKGKDYACSEFDTVLDLGALRSAVADMKRQLGR